MLTPPDLTGKETVAGGYTALVPGAARTTTERSDVVAQRGVGGPSSSSLRHDDVVSMRAGFAAQQAAAESRRAAGASSAPAPESQAAAPADETRTEAEPAAAGPATADTADAAPAPAPAPAPASVTSPRKFGSDEPEVNTRADAKEWRRWATEHSKAYADTVHPRLVRKGKPPVKLPLRAKPNDVINSVGIAPALYLDFLKLCAGYCAVGALFSVPSYLSSYAHASEVYDRNTTSLYPTSLLVLSVAARAECATEGCKQINLLASILRSSFDAAAAGRDGLPETCAKARRGE